MSDLDYDIEDQGQSGKKVLTLSLTRKLLLWFFALAVFPMLLIASLSYYQAYSSLRQESVNELVQAADLNVRFIQNWFNYRFIDITYQADSDTYRQLLYSLSQGYEKSNVSLEEYVKSDEWRRRAGDLQDSINRLSFTYPYIYDVFLIDNKGNILYAVEKESDFGTNLLTGPYQNTKFAKIVRDVLDQKKTLFSDIERYEPSNGRADGFIATPLIGSDDEPMGVFAIQIRMEQLINVLSSDVANIDARHYLVGSDGLLRTSPNDDSSEVLTRRIETEQFEKWYQEHSEGVHEGGVSEVHRDDKSSLYHIHDLELDHEEAFEYLGPNGNEVIGIHYSVRIFNVEWALISEIDKRVALSSAYWLRNIIIACVVIIGLISLILAIIQSRRLIRPVKTLSEATMAVAAGEMDQRVEVGSRDELGRLAEAFNHMLTMRQMHEKALEASHQESQLALNALEEKTKELIIANQEAEAAVRTKGEFLASMSHEIRTPMNGVLGMLSLLSNSELNKEQSHQVALARSSANSLLAVINDILDFSKIEAGKLDIEALDFNLRTMIGEFSEAIGHRPGEEDVELVIDVVDVRETLVRGDPGRIRQILSNLVGNAVKFTHSGEIYVRVGLAPEIASDGKRKLRLSCSVNDTGIGIPADKMPSLFDSFTQVDASTTRRYGGTGLGLAIVKQLCEIMGGSISATSEEGVGSCFTFNVLLESCEESKVVTPDLDLSDVSLLIVDDNLSHCAFLVRQLQEWGAEVEDVNNAEDALELLSQRLEQDGASMFTGIFIDMGMPGTDGVELGRRIRSDKRFTDLRLVMMTSLQNRGDARFFSDLGFSAYFPKPTTTRDLLESLDMICSEQSAGNSSQRVSDHCKGLQHNGIFRKEEKLPSGYQWPEGTRILLVEDNPVNQTVALAVLDLLKLSADVADSGLDALVALQNSPEDMPYSLILMDCQMPGMDGYEATAEIRGGAAGIRYKDVRIMAMTANAMKGDKEKCLAAGMDDYLSKPIDTEALERKLYFHLVAQNGSGGKSLSEERVLEESSSEEGVLEEGVLEENQLQESLHREVVSVANGEDDLEGQNALESENVCDKTEQSNKTSENNMSALPIWDQEDVLRRVMGKEKILQVMIASFTSDMPRYVEELQNHLDKGDIEAAGGSAHALKGVAANLSALALAEAARKIELACKEDKPLDDVLVHHQEFVALYPQTCTEIEAWSPSN